MLQVQKKGKVLRVLLKDISLKDTNTCSFKNWATATGFIIAIAFSNFLTEVANLSSSNRTPTKIRTKKLQKSDGFSVIHTKDIPLLIINPLIINLCSKHLAKKWGQRDATICTWRSNVRIIWLEHFPIVLILAAALFKSSKLNKSTWA